MRHGLLALGALTASAATGTSPDGCGDDGANDACEEEGELLHLTAGQTTPVGGLYVQNDDETLFVSYETTDGWLLDEVHLHVACSREDIPSNGGGNVVPGQFDWSESFSPGVTAHTFVIPLSSLSCAPECGDELTLAAHAAVSNPDTGGAETAWGSTFDPNDPPADAASYAFGGARWGWYAPYVLSCCVGEDPPGDDDDDDDGTFPGETVYGPDSGWSYGGSGGRGSETYVIPLPDTGLATDPQDTGVATDG
jgi:hypothetical protein